MGQGGILGTSGERSPFQFDLLVLLHLGLIFSTVTFQKRPSIGEKLKPTGRLAGHAEDSPLLGFSGLKHRRARNKPVRVQIGSKAFAR